MKQLTRQFLRRTLERMKELAKVDPQEAAAALKDMKVRFSDMVLTKCWLEDVAAIMAKTAVQTCVECGGPVNYKMIAPDHVEVAYGRTDRRYCSPKCRQRAYRKRAL
jgi:hypothetical protein